MINTYIDNSERIAKSGKIEKFTREKRKRVCQLQYHSQQSIGAKILAISLDEKASRGHVIGKFVRFTRILTEMNLECWLIQREIYKNDMSERSISVRAFKLHR